jgi:hypothetical protein
MQVIKLRSCRKQRNKVPHFFVAIVLVLCDIDHVETTHNASHKRKRVMTTTATLLARLNELRVANDKKPVVKWKASRAKLEDAIAELTPTKGAGRATSPIADYFREMGINPKVGRAKLRRHLEKPANGWEVTSQVRKLFEAA